MENLWETIAKSRGVEMNEEFSYSWSIFTFKLRISEEGLEVYEDGRWCSSSCANIFIKGDGEIERLPFRPQIGGRYYTTFTNNSVITEMWLDSAADYARLIVGLVFRTREEAKAYLPTWQEKISKL